MRDFSSIWLPQMCGHATADGKLVICLTHWRELFVTTENVDSPWYIGPHGLVRTVGEASNFAGTGPQGIQGPAGPQGAQGPQGPQGAPGTNGTNSATLVGTVTLAESSLVTLALSVRRVTVALSGAVTTGSYIAVPVSAPPTGYSIQDAYCGTNNQITVGLIVPVLGVGSSYSIQVRIFRLL